MEEFRLHRTLVSADGLASPPQWMVVVHGIWGSGANLRLFGRKLVALRPDWGLMLVDLRGHGQSAGGHAPSPHSVLAAAADVTCIARESGLPVRAVLGHSFGGKVATRVAVQLRDLTQLWVLDSNPGVKPAADKIDEADPLSLVETLRRFSANIETREKFIAGLESTGISPSVAQFLGMSVRRDEAGFLALRLDLDTIAEMLRDYYRDDTWSLLESLKYDFGTAVHFVAGGRSQAVGKEGLARLRDDDPDKLSLHVLPNAGHWLHVDDPDGLLRILSASLPRS